MTKDKSKEPMNSRQTYFEVVRREEIPSLLQHASPRILSLSHDASLAQTRELLFSSAGFEVFTFLDIAKALKACQTQSFDLVVVGHSIPLGSREAFVKELRRLSSAPVIAILRPGELHLAGSDYSFDSALSPGLLLGMVKEIFRSKI